MIQEHPPEIRVDRRMIRRALVELVRSMHLTYGQRVYSNRMVPISVRRLPAVAIYTLREKSELRTVSPRRYKRELEVVIEVLDGVAPPQDGAEDLAQASDGLDDQLDGITLEIESRLERDTTLGGLVHDTVQDRWEYEPVDQGERRLAFSRLILTITYETEAGERPESGFPPLHTVESGLRPSGSSEHALHDVHKIDP